MVYDWKAALVFFGSLLVLTWIVRFLIFKIPEYQRMRELNREADRPKLARDAYKKIVKQNGKLGLWTNLIFYATILPFCVSLETRPAWEYVVNIVLVLLVFDFFYYLTHRFVFHGKLLFRVHALHHKALTPTYIDAHYVHPLETFIGLVLFLGSIPLVALLIGTPLNAVSVAVATLVFTQVNTLNHTYVNLPRFPFKTVDRITSLHAAHHVDMQQGNYATLTMLYDWAFGTLEKPVSRTSP